MLPADGPCRSAGAPRRHGSVQIEDPHAEFHPFAGTDTWLLFPGHQSLPLPRMFLLVASCV